jgi:glycine C-acetyltransferase/8-amino-7-oxononanoate synthase
MASYLVNSARTFIFSTAPPPPAVAGALAAVELLQERPRRVQKLQSNVEALRSELGREGFDVSGSRTQVIPLVVGDPALAVEICEKALARGVFAQAIRPPTVPPMTSRLRLAVMASHRPEELREAARILAQTARAAGFEPRAHATPAQSLAIDSDEHPPLAEEAPMAAPSPIAVFDFEQDPSAARAA